MLVQCHLCFCNNLTLQCPNGKPNGPLNTLPAAWIAFFPTSPPNLMPNFAQWLPHPLLQARHGFDRREGKHTDYPNPSTPSRRRMVIGRFQHVNTQKNNKPHHWCWTKNLPLDFHHAGLDRTGLSDLTTAYRVCVGITQTDVKLKPNAATTRPTPLRQLYSHPVVDASNWR